MSENQARVSIRILEKEYHITCPIEERSDLLDSAEFLNMKMREIRDSCKVVGLDRIAVIAAIRWAIVTANPIASGTKLPRNLSMRVAKTAASTSVVANI